MFAQNFQPFALEKLLSDYEQTVDFNYSESGVLPVVLRELLDMAPGAEGALMDTPMNYPEVNGDTDLRARIADRYKGANVEDVLVTVGASEANFLIASTLLSPGDEIACMRPTYMQIWGIAQNLGVKINAFDLNEGQGWALDTDALEAAVTDKTKIIAVTNPNNPTGRIMTPAEMDAIVAAADRVGAWLLADEVYSGAERAGGDETPSFYGRYDKVIAVNSLSKAYGLPGLRCGWITAPRSLVSELWRRHEYTTISASMLGNRLATLALDPSVRPQLIARTRGLIRKGFDVLAEALAVHPGVFSVNPPGASALSFPRYNLPLSSGEFAGRLRTEKSVLMVPGDHFALDKHLRISFALPTDYLREGLGRMNELVGEIIGG